MPARGHAEVRARICTQQTDEDLGHDPPARRSESMPAAEHLRLLENVEEQGRTPPEDLDQVFRERLHVVGVQDQIVRDPDGSRDRLAGGDAEGLAALQVSLREGMDFLRDGLGQDAFPKLSFESILRLGWTCSWLSSNWKNRAHWITCPSGSSRKPRRSSS